MDAQQTKKNPKKTCMPPKNQHADMHHEILPVPACNQIPYMHAP